MPISPFLNAAALTAAIMTAGSPADPLAPLRWSKRVVVVVAPSPSDARLEEQRRLYRAGVSGSRERDLVLIEGVGTSPVATRLRERFGLDLGEFAAILVGKDGGEKLRSAEPIAAEELFATIDAMPMRLDEMRRDEMRRATSR